MYLNLIQIAESFGVSEQVITEWVRNEGMPHVHDRERILFERSQVMDWADLLAYAVYDFEDFVRSGDIPIAHLRASTAERQWLLHRVFERRQVPGEQQELYAQVLDRLLADCPTRSDGARHVRRLLLRR